MIRQFTRCYPIGTIYPISNFLKAGLKYFISLAMSYAQRVFAFFLSSAYTCATDLGTSILNLCVFLRYQAFLLFTREIILNLLLNTEFTHQLNVSSWYISWAMAYSSVSTGRYSFISLIVYHDIDPSLHWTHIYNPDVDFRMKLQPLCTTFWLENDMAYHSYGIPLLSP